MDMFGDTDILGTWLQLLLSPFGLMLVGVAVFRIAIDRLLPPKRHRRPTGSSSGKTRPSQDLLSLALLFSGAWIAIDALTPDHSGTTSLSSLPNCLGVLTTGSWLGFAVAKAHEDTIRKRKGSLYRSLEDLNTLSPSDFEEFVAELFRRRGYQAKVVGQDGDHGVDIVVKNPEGERELVQCKRWEGKWIGEPVVRDFYGALVHDGEAVRGYIVTTTFFSRAAREWTKGKPIDLVDGKKLVESVPLIG